MRIYANVDSLPSDAERADAYAVVDSLHSHPESMTTERAYRYHCATEALRALSGTRCAFVAYAVVDTDNVTADNPRIVYAEHERHSSFVLRTKNPSYNVNGAITTGERAINVVAVFGKDGKLQWSQGPNTLTRQRYDSRKTVDTRHGGTYKVTRKLAYTEPSPDGGDWTPIVCGYAYASDLFAANKHGRKDFEYETAEGTFRWHSLGDRLRIHIKPLDSKYARNGKHRDNTAKRYDPSGIVGGSQKPFVANRCANAIGRSRGFGAVIGAALDYAKADNNATAAAILLAMLRAGNAECIQPMRSNRPNSRCKDLERYLTADDLDRFTLLRMPASDVQEIVRPFVESAMLGS
jgi:hypothetical protein